MLTLSGAVTDGQITHDAAPGAELLDVAGCVVTPGLVNAHHHLLQTAFRTLPGTRGVPMASWLPTMAAAYAAAGVDGELAGAAAAAGLAEALLSGVTTVADHHLTWPGDVAETFRLLGEVAARHGLRRRTQANEQVDVAAAVERYGRRPLDLLDEWGWLAPDVTLAHLCGITDDEL